MFRVGRVPRVTVPVAGRQSAAGRARRIVVVAALGAGLLQAFTAPPALAATTPVGSTEFTFVAIPDTQNMFEGDSDERQRGVAQIQWIADSKASLRSVWAAQLGDVVNTNTSQSAYTTASNAFKILDNANFPYSVLPGNHDLGLADGDAALFESTFPPSRFSSRSPWQSAWSTAQYGGYLGPGQPYALSTDPDRESMDNWGTFTAGGMDFLVVNLEYGLPNFAVAWAGRVLDAHPGYRAIIATHGFLETDGSRMTDYSTDPPSYDDIPGASATTPATVFTNLIAPRCNVFLVIAGHNYDDDSYTSGEAHRTDMHTNSACLSTPVYQVLSDYQSRSMGTGTNTMGTLRYYVFDPDNDRIHARTYNPWTGLYETDASSQFDLTYDMVSVTPQLPGKPTSVSATAGNATANVTWTAAPSNGGTIDHYVVTPYVGGTAQSGLVVQVGNTTSADVPGLTNGTAYTFTVRAHSNVGDGPESDPSGAVTPSAPVDHAPVAVNDSATTAEDGSVAIHVLANDTDADGDSLTAILVSGPTHGTGNLLSNGIFAYTPAANFNGADSFTYQASDGSLPSNTATVTITVTPVNDPPSFAKGADQTVAEDSGPASLLGWATGMSAGPADEASQNLSFVIDSNTNGALFSAGPAVDPTGTLSFTPAPNANGSATLVLHLVDSGGTAGGGVDASPTQSFTITVTPVNDPPVAGNDLATTVIDTPLLIAPATLLANDTDPDGDVLAVAGVSSPVHGTVEIVASGADLGKILFTPEAAYLGPASFSYTVSDGLGGTATGSVTVTVATVNHAPIAVDDSATTAQGSSVTIRVLDNDTDADGDSLTATLVTQPSHGTASVVNGTINYVPATGFSGSDSFTYVASDASLQSNTATVSITVTPNHPPVAVDDAASTLVNTALLIAPATLLANDSDPDGDTLSVTAVSSGDHGTVVIVGSGTDKGKIRFTPQSGYVGSDSFSYTVSDGKSGTATGTVTVTISATMTVPGAPTGVTAVLGSGGATVSWSAPASDGGSAITSYSVTSSPAGKTCTTTGALNCTATGLAANTAYTFTVQAGNAVGWGPASAPSNSVGGVISLPAGSSTYHPINPVRLLDTRSGNGLSGKLVANTPEDVPDHRPERHSGQGDRGHREPHRGQSVGPLGGLPRA